MTEDVKKSLKLKLMELLKSEGLEATEEAAEALVNLSLKAIDVIVGHTTIPYDDMVWAAVKGKVEELADGLVDKIDGKIGN